VPKTSLIVKDARCASAAGYEEKPRAIRRVGNTVVGASLERDWEWSHIQRATR
jgi:hypothetical protein